MSSNEEKPQEAAVSPFLRISGTKISKVVRAQLAEEVGALEGDKPTLAVVLVGERKDSQTYVRMKTKACAEVGLNSVQRDLPADATQEQVLSVVRELNNDPSVNGILVQLPLPKHMDSDEVIAAIAPNKDVDGLHKENAGDVFVRGHRANLIPCTPKGCIELLDQSGVTIEGKRAVVLGRSQLVGKPIAQLLMSRNATVTQCHSRTKDIPSIVRESDIVVAAIGRANFVKGDWLKPGCVVIDVGINAVDDASKKRGYRLVGDVDYAAAKKVASAATPVPGGVGPMTVAMLLRNTLTAFKMQHQ